MIARLRRHRWLAALLFLASPGVAGQLLPVLHPCPVDMPWVAMHGTMAGMAHHASHAPGHTAHHECSCIGCCATPAIAMAPEPVVATFAAELPHHTTWVVVEAIDHRPAFVDRLPEKPLHLSPDPGASAPFI